MLVPQERREADTGGRGIAEPEEIFEFYRNHGFFLDFLQTGGLGCNEFVFACAQLESRSVAA